MIMVDVVNLDENYGFWFDKNDNLVIYLEVVIFMICFVFEWYGNKVGWNIVGLVCM